MIPHIQGMKLFGGILVAAVLACGCGDSASQACGELCSMPDECFAELGIPPQGSDCMQACEAQVEYVGVECINVIADTIECLGTCDVESLTNEELLACQDEALSIESACD